MTMHRAHYDTVVLGAGLGGLVAGTALAKAGRKTVVLEERSHPGGVSTIMHVDGYPFARSPALLFGLEKDGYCDRLLSDLGLSLTLLKRPGAVLKQPAPILQIVTERFRIDIEASRDAQLSEYKREWGEASVGLLKFYKALDHLDCLIYPYFFRKDPSGPSASFWRRLVRGLQGLRQRRAARNHSRRSIGQVLSQFGLPPDFQRAMELMTVLAFRSDLKTTPALNLVILLTLLSREVFRPIGGLRRLCEEVAKVCQASRCELRYHQGITALTRKGRNEWSIALMSGEEIQARRLIIHFPWHRIKPYDFGLTSFFFAVDSSVIPSPMGEQIVMQRHSASSPGFDGPLFVAMSLSDEEKGLMENKRLLCVTALIRRNGASQEPDSRALLHDVIKNLQWLMPFSGGKVHYLGHDAAEEQAQEKRMAYVAPFLKRLRIVEKPQYMYGYQPFDRSLFVLPDLGNTPALLPAEIRAAAVLAHRLVKYR